MHYFSKSTQCISISTNLSAFYVHPPIFYYSCFNSFQNISNFTTLPGTAASALSYSSLTEGGIPMLNIDLRSFALPKNQREIALTKTTGDYLKVVIHFLIKKRTSSKQKSGLFFFIIVVSTELWPL